MEIYLTRQEIRRQMRAHLGQTMTEAAAAQTFEQYNVFIESAQLKGLGDCAWLAAQGRVTVDLGVAQYKLAYPTDTGVGSILEVALYDTGSSWYRPLVSRDLSLLYDTDQQEIAGGTDFTAVQGEPMNWQQRADAIYLFPVNDTTARKIRLRYSLRKTFASDVQTSTIDGLAIVYWATALAYAAIEQAEQAQRYQGLYLDRISQLRAWQNTGQRVAASREGNFDEDDENQARPWPNWDTRART